MYLVVTKSEEIRPHAIPTEGRNQDLRGAHGGQSISVGEGE